MERATRLKRYLSPQLAEVILSSGDESLLAHHRREITVVFCDLRGFTAFAETAEPEEVMGVLGEYHAALGELSRISAAPPAPRLPALARTACPSRGTA